MKLKYILILSMLLCLTACSKDNTVDIPEPSYDSVTTEQTDVQDVVPSVGNNTVVEENNKPSMGDIIITEDLFDIEDKSDLSGIKVPDNTGIGVATTQDFTIPMGSVEEPVVTLWLDSIAGEYKVISNKSSVENDAILDYREISYDGSNYAFYIVSDYDTAFELTKQISYKLKEENTELQAKLGSKVMSEKEREVYDFYFDFNNRVINSTLMEPTMFEKDEDADVYFWLNGQINSECIYYTDEEGVKHKAYSPVLTAIADLKGSYLVVKTLNSTETGFLKGIKGGQYVDKLSEEERQKFMDEFYNDSNMSICDNPYFAKWITETFCYERDFTEDQRLRLQEIFKLVVYGSLE